MYQATDKFLKLLKKTIQREFNYLSVHSFDELNVVQTSNGLKDMFFRLLGFNKEQYLILAKEAHDYGLQTLNQEEKDQEGKVKFSEDEMVEYVLANYNRITGYLYEKEAERKRLRLSEEILTAREFLDRTLFSKSLKRGANLWYTQSMQYAIDIEDHTLLTTYERAGVEKVQWVAEKDERTCNVCMKLDGKVFGINEVPGKTHYNCRCYIIPYRGKNS